MGSKQVSTIGLGTWQFGERGWGWGQDFDNREIERIIDRALELGINFFDTAAVYGNGRSEGILGKALQGRRLRLWDRTRLSGLPRKASNA